jgi:hypothetical protein
MRLTHGTLQTKCSLYTTTTNVTLYALKAEPYWASNYSAFNTSWSTDTFNTTTQVKSAINSTAQEYYQINVSCANIKGSPDTDFCTDATGASSGFVSNANISTTTCGGNDKVSGINNATGIVTCTADQTGTGSGGLTLSDLFASKYYWKSVGFESVTAGYTEPLVPTAIASGTTALVAGEVEHPGIASISTSATASSGYAFQITGATTYSLSSNYTTEISFMPYNKTGNVTVLRIGFMDAYATTLPVDGVYFNATQINATHFRIRGESRSNSIQTNTATQLDIPAQRWLTGKIYINSSSLVTFIIHNGTTTLWTNTVASNIPTGVGRETSFAFVGYTVGGTTAQVLARVDYITIGIDRALVR